MTHSTLAISGGKSRQFTISKIDTIFDFYKPKPPLSKFIDNFCRSMVAAVVGLISLVIGGLARARSSGRIGSGNGRAGAIAALVLGLIGIILSVMHLGSSTGFGTGGGRAGAIVALVLALIGMSLGGLALARSQRSRPTGS